MITGRPPQIPSGHVGEELGPVEGDAEGLLNGVPLGLVEIASVGSLEGLADDGMDEGAKVGTVLDTTDGVPLGLPEGPWLGENDTTTEGGDDGSDELDGAPESTRVGTELGKREGCSEGLPLGSTEGTELNQKVG